MGGCGCNCGNNMNGQDLQLNLGMDYDGVCEVHQYHYDHGMNKRMSYEDLFFRQCFKPMHLMKVDEMFKLIDEIQKAYDQQLRQVSQMACNTGRTSQTQESFQYVSRDPSKQTLSYNQQQNESDDDSQESADSSALDFKTIPLSFIVEHLSKMFHFKNDITNSDSAFRQILAYRDIFSRFVIDEQLKSKFINDSSINSSNNKSKMQSSFDHSFRDLIQAGINGNLDLSHDSNQWTTQMLFYKSYKDYQLDLEIENNLQKNLKKRSYRANALNNQKPDEIAQHIVYSQGFGVQDISKWNQINLKELASTQANSHIISRQVDMYQLQTTALFLCRGTEKEKADLLVKLIKQTFSNKNILKKKVYYENPYLQRTIKFMFYMSVILPYKFMHDSQSHSVFKDILFHENMAFNKPEKRNSQKAQKKVKEFLDKLDGNKQIGMAEQYFDEVFNKIYEERIIGYIFKNGSLLSTDEFVQKICPERGLLDFNFASNPRKKSNIHEAILPLDSEEDMTWLFSPVHLRKIFYTDLEVYLKELQEEQSGDEFGE